MPNRTISESKSFITALNKYFQYKEKTMEDKAHALLKYNQIINFIVSISVLESYPGKKVNYRNSKKFELF